MSRSEDHQYAAAAAAAAAADEASGQALEDLMNKNVKMAAGGAERQHRLAPAGVAGPRGEEYEDTEEEGEEFDEEGEGEYEDTEDGEEGEEDEEEYEEDWLGAIAELMQFYFCTGKHKMPIADVMYGMKKAMDRQNDLLEALLSHLAARKSR